MTACPFCGSNKLKFDGKTKRSGWENGGPVDAYTGSIRCNRCHARGPTVSIKYDARSFEARKAAYEDIEKLAFDAWNNRK